MTFTTKYAAFTNRSNDFKKFCEMLDTFPNDDRKFDRVLSCLSVGTGAGKWEIEFIKRFMPNLKSFTAIDADASSATELRANLERELPTLEVEVHHTTVEKALLGTDNCSVKSHDAVLLFHVLYHLDEENRAALYKTIFDKVLPSGGLVVINHTSLSSDPDDIEVLNVCLKPGQISLVTEKIKQEIVKCGFVHDRERDYTLYVDFSNPDDLMLRFMADHMISTPSLSMDELRSAVEQVLDKKIASSVYTLCVYQKP